MRGVLQIHNFFGGQAFSNQKHLTEANKTYLVFLAGQPLVVGVGALVVGVDAPRFGGTFRPEWGARNADLDLAQFF